MERVLARCLCGMLLVTLWASTAWSQGLAGQAEAPPAKLLATVSDLPDWATSVAFAPDGRTLAAGSYEVVVLWDVDAKSEQQRIPFKYGFARSVAYSPDGQLLAIGGFQRIVLVNATSHEVVAELKGHRGYVNDVTFSADGSLLASGSEDLTVKLWTSADWSELRSIEGHTYPIQSVSFSPTGDVVASAAGDETRLTRPGEVMTWSVESGERLHEFPAHERGATSVAFAPDGSRLVSTSLDEHVNVYNPATGEAQGFFGGHSRPTNAALFAADGNMVVSGSGGRFKGLNEVIFWNPADGEEYAKLDHHAQKISAMALAADGVTLATASYDNTVTVWDITPILEKAGFAVAQADDDVAAEPKVIRVGIIGLDTSHSIAFTNLLNAENPDEAVSGCRVVAAYPHGSADIESSTSRIPKYTEDMQAKGIEIVDSIDALLERVDAVCLETNDGRPHLDQIIPVLKAGKPVFVDKPIAASLADAIAIFEAARHYGVPTFSSSSLRWIVGAQDVRGGSIGAVTGADVYSPCSLEETHPDLFWYGIHGVEALFTVMGTGCETVSRTSTDDFEVAVGTWGDGRIGTFRGIRKGKGGYGGMAFGENGTQVLGPYGGYAPLVEQIVRMFKTGEVPVTEAETLEIYAFMEAADESKRQGGKPVRIADVMEAARAEAAERLEGKLE